MIRGNVPTGMGRTTQSQITRFVADFLASNPQPSALDLAEAGIVAPHWPAPWGLGATPGEQLEIDYMLAESGVRRPSNPIGVGWAGPTILHAGTLSQKQRYLTPLLSGEEQWCQLFSEPGAGSDLASIQTRAQICEGGFLVNGSKIWTSHAKASKFGILLARTGGAGRSGISYFICDMDSPGVQIRPIVEMTGAALFNEVFLTDVFVPAENLVGDLNDGWRLAKVTLANERVSLSEGGLLWGLGPDFDEFFQAVRSTTLSSVQRERLVGLAIEARVLSLMKSRVVSSAIAGRQPGPEVSLRKLLADVFGQKVMNLAKDVAGAYGMLNDGGPLSGPWGFSFLFSRALTIGGGTTEVQKNIIGERVLGLPAEARVGATSS